MHHLGTFALFLFGFQIATNDDLETSYVSIIDGVIRGESSHKNTSVQTFLTCVVLGCDVAARCAGSFNNKTGVCMTATLSAAPLAWTKDLLFSNSSDKDWVSFAPTTSLPSLPAPAGLWTMDSSFRGRNLGSKGPRLNSSDTGIVWSSDGPLGSFSPLKYARLNGGQKARIQNCYGSTYLMDFKKPFTVAFWAITDNRAAIMPVLDGWNTARNTYASFIWFHPSTQFDQMNFLGKEVVTSTRDGRNKLFWRHIALTFRGGSAYSYYLNATAWGWSRHSHSHNYVTDFYTIGHRQSASHVFKGSLACISFFEVALSTQQVGRLMQSCP